MAEKAQLDRPAAVRRVLARAESAEALLHELQASEASLHQRVLTAYQASQATAARGRLQAIPVQRLKDVTGARLPVARLEEAGYRTLLDLVDATPAHLQQLPGIGAKGADRVVAAVGQIARATEQNTQITADLDLTAPDAAALLAALYRVQGAERDLVRVREPARRIGTALAGLLPAARPLGSRIRRMFLRTARRDHAQDAVSGLDSLLSDPKTAQELERIDAANQRIQYRPPRPGTVRNDFEKHSADYFSVLGRIVGVLGGGGEAANGYLSDDLATRVAEQKLDQTHLRVSLRGYQDFGARFALAQRRVIIGDEMGCGKTIEAIAALAHLRADGATHFLVIAPASVLINWMREIGGHSALRAHRLHGPDRDAAVRAWVARGGVGVTTFEALRGLEPPAGLKVGMLVVDEAHYVKNPDTLRSATVRAWTDRVERVLFLTGTPMENKVAEFRNLVDYLQPELVASIGEIDAVAGSESFRRAVGPAYLRRNQEDVLSELPELVHVDEWEEFGPEDAAAYREAVAARNFMAMRRAAYSSGDPRSSAKLRRLVEIADEAGACGRKVVVFSYFRDVLDLVCRTLGERASGPLTGSVPPPRRQELVDEFSATKGHAVLVSQIQAGGVGLNMQAASVIILCEPQVKPTLEAQAIARARRMGQIRGVQVHRLLATDSVDQRMLELLGTKTELFDAFARRSHTAETVPQATDTAVVADVAGPALARQIIDAERDRLGLGA